MSKDEFFESWSAMHGGAEIAGIVRAWLTISYWITRPLVILRISPNLLSILSIISAVAFLAFIESNWSVFFLVVSLLFDGIDGTVAILTNKSSRFGAVIDSVADRMVEAFWAYGFYLLGAPWQIVLAAWTAAFIQEYLRARAGGLGVSEVIKVTWAERPIRATLIFIPLIAGLFGMELFAVAAWIWFAMQTSSALYLMNSLRLRLRQSQR